MKTFLILGAGTGGTMVANATDECRKVAVRMRRSLAAVGTKETDATGEKTSPDFFKTEDT